MITKLYGYDDSDRMEFDSNPSKTVTSMYDSDSEKRFS